MIHQVCAFAQSDVTAINTLLITRCSPALIASALRVKKEEGAGGEFMTGAKQWLKSCWVKTITAVKDHNQDDDDASLLKIWSATHQLGFVQCL